MPFDNFFDDYDPEGNGYSGLPGYGTDPNAGFNYNGGDTFGDDWYNGWGGDNTLLGSRQTVPYATGTVRGLSSGTSYQNLAGQGGNAILRMLQQQGNNSNLSDLGRLAGAFSQGERNNRNERGRLTQNYDRIMLDAQRARNENEHDAMRGLAQTSYIQGGGSHFTPPNLSINGRNYNSPDLGFGPTPISDAERRGAASLQPQLERRLQPGGSYTPTPVGDYANPGTLENIGSYAALGLSGAGAISNFFNRNNGDGIGTNGAPSGDTPSGSNGGPSNTSRALGYATTGLGLARASGLIGGSSGASGAAAGATGGASALSYIGPGIGAAAGIYGLSRNTNTMGNIAAGTGAGASIGTMIMPGYGTAIGAGVGALYGALQSWLTVTEQEKQGRVAQGTAIQQLTRIATPEQRAGAANSGWPDPNQALGLIVMRDTFRQSGLSPEESESRAEAIMHGMWDAEGGGANDVAEAFQPIANLMNQYHGGQQNG